VFAIESFIFTLVKTATNIIIVREKETIDSSKGKEYAPIINPKLAKICRIAIIILSLLYPHLSYSEIKRLEKKEFTP